MACLPTGQLTATSATHDVATSTHDRRQTPLLALIWAAGKDDAQAREILQELRV